MADDYAAQLAEALRTHDLSALPGGLQPYFSYMEQQNGLPRGFLSQAAQIESKYDPNAVSPTGATGLFQMTKGPSQAYGLSPAARTDPFWNTEATVAMAKDNFRQLGNKLGRDPNAGELYLAHQEGATGASKIIQADPSSRVASLGPQIARNIGHNGGERSDRIGDWAGKFTGRFDNSQAYQPSAAGPVGSDPFYTGQASPDPGQQGVLPTAANGASMLTPGAPALDPQTAALLAQALRQQPDPSLAMADGGGSAFDASY